MNQLERDGEWKEKSVGYDHDDARDAADVWSGRALAHVRRLDGDETDRGEQILDALAQERAALQDALARNAAARAKVQAQQEQKLKMGQDVFIDGTVIRWVKRFRNADGTLSDQSYTYAAVKAAGKWYTTGSTTRAGAAHGRSWQGLLAFMIARGLVESADVMEVERQLV